MECAICHRKLTLSGPDRETRVSLIEDGAAFCHRCAIDVTRDVADAPRDEASGEPEPLAMAA